MGGVYSAVVIGPEGKDIFSDALGRVKVRFPWDRRQESTPDGSIWVRVIQSWAGLRFGCQFLPRVGSEVAVAFVDGDIDRPVIVGCLFNGREKPIFPPKVDETKSGIRTRSVDNGGPSEYSEISLDDKRGKEAILIHSQRDLIKEAENDCLTNVGRNDNINISGTQTTNIKGDRNVTVEGAQHVRIASGNFEINVVKADIHVEATMGIITLKALTAIKLMVGPSSLIIDQSGITLKGPLINLN
jgi:type VI secretion system secreted protein VgrG